MSMPYSYHSPRGYQNGDIPGQGQGKIYPNSYNGEAQVNSKNTMGFTFRNRYERLDWRKIGMLILQLLFTFKTDIALIQERKKKE